jgi:hypothetical protein
VRALVYTAIFGNYDDLKQPVGQNEPCDFICFTDTPMPSRVGVWRVIQVKTDTNVHPRMQAKRFKLLSHRIFPHGRLAARYAPFAIRRRADLSIWIDANLQIKSPTFVQDMRNILGNGDWAMFVHPDRDCIYDEAVASLPMRKYQGLPILRQVEAYRTAVPAHGGLYACTILVRREPLAERLERLNELWWDENVKWTYQDQLSLPFVLRCAGGCNPAGIACHLRQNDWFDILPHNSDA